MKTSDAETSAAGMRRPGQRSARGVWELLYTLTLKELKVKYKRSILGFLWSLITPLALSGVYLFVFIYVWKVDQEDYILFLLSGLFPWHFFNLSLLAGTTSLVENSPIIKKVYFPRELLPLSVVGANLANFLVVLGLLSVVVLATGRPLLGQLHWLLLAVVMQTALCSGTALALSAWNVYVRDIQQVISILIMVLFFATPIVYPLARVDSAFLPLLKANPLTSVMEVYRAALYYMKPPDLGLVALGVAEVTAVAALGYWTFRRLSPQFAKEL